MPGEFLKNAWFSLLIGKRTYFAQTIVQLKPSFGYYVQLEPWGEAAQWLQRLRGERRQDKNPCDGPLIVLPIPDCQYKTKQSGVHILRLLKLVYTPEIELSLLRACIIGICQISECDRKNFSLPCLLQSFSLSLLHSSHSLYLLCKANCREIAVCTFT